jgi:hypothetical protein
MKEIQRFEWQTAMASAVVALAELPYTCFATGRRAVLCNRQMNPICLTALGTLSFATMARCAGRTTRTPHPKSTWRPRLSSSFTMAALIANENPTSLDFRKCHGITNCVSQLRTPSSLVSLEILYCIVLVLTVLYTRTAQMLLDSS